MKHGTKLAVLICINVLLHAKLQKWLIKMEVHAYGHNKYFEILPHVLSKQLQN